MSEYAPSELLPTRTIDTTAGLIRVSMSGEGEIPLVFTHGYPDNLQIWSRTIDQLAGRYPVIAFDWPGLGQSGEPAEKGGTPYHLGRALISLMDHLGLEEAIPVGFDMGAHAVVAAVHANPDRFPKLVLSNFLAFGDLPTSWEIAVMRKLGLNRFFIGRTPQIVFKRAEKTFLPKNQKLSSATRADMWQSFTLPSSRHQLVKMCAGYQASLKRIAKLYPEIKTPTLLLWADQDSHFPIGQGKALEKSLENSQLQILEDSHHWFMWQSPKHAAEQLLNFVR